ncbi:uncharacterized protein METZ01_LOCUS367138, partial [marine metagenome]
GLISTTVSSLEKGKLYFFRVSAENSVGSVVSQNVGVFTTQPEIPVPGLWEYCFNGTFSDTNLDPIDAGSGYLTAGLVPIKTTIWSSNQNFDFSEGAMMARSGSQFANDYYGMAWSGALVVGGSSPVTAGAVSFGTRSDDGSILWIDVNRNGVFEAGELVVDNKGLHGNVNRAGNVTLADGNYKWAAGIYELDGGAYMGVRWKQGVETNYDNMTFVNPGANPGMFQTAATFPTRNITSPTTASGTVGPPFSFQITTNVANPLFSAYNLPPGLACNPSTGAISGILQTGGVYSVTVAAQGTTNTVTGSL